jgi:hypothetical protein
MFTRLVEINTKYGNPKIFTFGVDLFTTHKIAADKAA